MANRKAVGPDGLPSELLKLLADERGLNTLETFDNIIVAECRGRGGPQQSNYETILMLDSKKHRDELAIFVSSPS